MNSDEQVAVGAAKAFNACVAGMSHDPAVQAQKETHDRAKADAVAAWAADEAAITQAYDRYRAEYWRIARRNGDDVRIGELRRRSSAEDDPASFASWAIDTAIAALDQKVRDKVLRETGLAMPGLPRRVDDRLDLPKLADPVLTCGNLSAEKIRNAGRNDWEAGRTLRQILDKYGPATYDRLTSPGP